MNKMIFWEMCMCLFVLLLNKFAESFSFIHFQIVNFDWTVVMLNDFKCAEVAENKLSNHKKKDRNARLNCENFITRANNQLPWSSLFVQNSWLKNRSAYKFCHMVATPVKLHFVVSMSTRCIGVHMSIYRIV